MIKEISRKYTKYLASVENMEKSCKFYSRIPGFKIEYGGSDADSFTTFKIGEDITKMYLNLELRTNNDIITHPNDRRNFGRIIFYTENVDELSQFKSDACISELISFENEPTDALWGERYFHIRDPDGYQLSFAMPVRKKAN